MKQQQSESQTEARQPLFRVRFYDGFTITTTAANALRAEQKARRHRAGFVESVRIINGVHYAK